MRRPLLGMILTAAFALSGVAIAYAAAPPTKHHAPAKSKPRGKPAHDAGPDLDAGSLVREESEGGVAEVRTLDSGTRVIKFGELEIEGQLQSPQIVYFLRRVRAEFDAENLGHRTFMRELSETRKEPNF